MRVLFAVHGFPPEVDGGTERTVRAIAQAMAAAGHEVTVVAGSLHPGDPEAVDEEQVEGLRVLRMHRDDLYFEDWDKAWSPGLSAAFGRLLERERPDVLHVQHWIRLSSDLLRQARARGVRTVVTLHDYYSALARPVRAWGDDSPRAADRVAGMGRAEQREVFELHRADFADEVAAAELCFVPSAAHGDGLRTMALGTLPELHVAPPPLLELPPRRPAAGPGQRERRLMVWGNLYPEKGVGMVLDALHSIGGGWSLDVLGQAHDPAYQRQLELAAGRSPVRFHGAFDRELLATIPCDYAILPASSHESYGLVLDEAQHMGLPTIAADLPAFREHAQEKATAWFTPADPGALCMLLLDDARLQQLAVPDVPRTWTAEQAAAQLVGAYEQLLRRAAPPAPAPQYLTPEQRAAALFRRAERRAWSARQQGEPLPPPDEFLGQSPASKP